MKFSSLLLLFTIIANLNFAQGIIFDQEWYDLQEETIRSTSDTLLLKTAFSLKPFLLDIGNQSKNKTCGPHSYNHAYTIRYNVLSSQEDGNNISNKKNFSASFMANSLDICETGTTFQVVFDFAKEKGICETKHFGEYPSCLKKPQQIHFDAAHSHKLSAFQKILDKKKNKNDEIREIKEFIQSGFPVIIGMTITENFKSCKGCEFWQPEEALSRIDKGIPVGHAMVILGFHGKGSKGYFEVLNSYGKDWGTSGIIKISYDDFWEHTHQAFIIYLACN